MPSDKERREPELGPQSRNNTGDSSLNLEENSQASPSNAIEEASLKPKVAPMWILIAAVILAAIVWVVSNQLTDSDKRLDSIPVISSEDNTYKERPSEPGGVDVENRDKYVYKSLEEHEAEPRIEQILPASEEPLDNISKIVTDTQLSEQKKQEDIPNIIENESFVTSEETITEPLVLKSNDEINVNENPVLPTDKNKLKISENEALVENKLTEPKQIIDTIKVPKKDIKNSFRVQIAASKNIDALKRDWLKMKNKFPNLLEDYIHHIVPPTEGDKGNWHRSRIGSFASKVDAVELCRLLKDVGISCFVVRGN